MVACIVHKSHTFGTGFAKIPHTLLIARATKVSTKPVEKEGREVRGGFTSLPLLLQKAIRVLRPPSALPRTATPVLTRKITHQMRKMSEKDRITPRPWRDGEAEKM